MNNLKIDLDKELLSYEFDATRFRSNRYIHLIVLILLFYVVGYFMFLIMVRDRNKIIKLKKKINNKINEASDELTIEEYMDFKKRLFNAGRS